VLCPKHNLLKDNDETLLDSVGLAGMGHDDWRRHSTFRTKRVLSLADGLRADVYGMRQGLRIDSLTASRLMELMTRSVTRSY